MFSWLVKLGVCDNFAELTKKGRYLTWSLIVIYSLFISYICFGPQHGISGVETPNIQYFGRVVVLLVPFNSLVSLGELTTIKELVWVIGQNAVNCLLLFPLMLGLVALFPSLRSWKISLGTAFLFSLFIESTQVILDILFDANRVFEIDDLWTNSLGGLLALWLYRWLVHSIKQAND